MRSRLLAASLLAAAATFPASAQHGGHAAPSAPVRVETLGLVVTIDVPGSATEGRTAAVSFVVPPGGGPPAHRHTREDEVFVIRAGTYRFLMDGVCITAGPGDSVYLPRGHIHQYVNIGTTPAEHTLVLQPAGLEQSFVDMAAMDLQMPRDFARLNELSISRYGLEYFPGHSFVPAECRPASGRPG